MVAGSREGTEQSGTEGEFRVSAACRQQSSLEGRVWDRRKSSRERLLEQPEGKHYCLLRQRRQGQKQAHRAWGRGSREFSLECVKLEMSVNHPRV